MCAQAVLSLSLSLSLSVILSLSQVMHIVLIEFVLEAGALVARWGT